MEVKQSVTEASVTNLKFFYNGIKAADGKLQKCYYSTANWINKPQDMIRIYGKNYKSFSAEVQAAFKVEDGSDMQSDYFENEHIDVLPTHPLYGEVLKALMAGKERNTRLAASRIVKAVA